MQSPWVAVDLAADRVSQARLLRRAHEVVLAGSGTPPVLRDVIVRSWARCTAAGVDPDRSAAVLLSAEEAAARFERHPLAAVAPIVRELLGAVSAEARHLTALGDADGVLLWADGHPRMLEAAAELHFAPGALCSESGVGTNAMGTALALNHAVQVFSAEHFSRLLHGWTCAASPIRDPATGALLGALNVAESFRHAHPHTLALVSATARAAEAHLARDRARRDAELAARYVDRLCASRRPSALVAADGRVLYAAPRGWLGARLDLPGGTSAVLPDGTEAVLEPVAHGARIVWPIRVNERRAPRRRLWIDALGADAAVVRRAGRRLPVTARQAELLVVLALHPAGLSAHDLAERVYGDSAKPVTARAEVARLRRVLGDLVGAQPYRLRADIRADVLEVEQLLASGRVAHAVDRYGGPLLPRSHAPTIVARREALEQGLDGAVRETADVRLAQRWARRRAGAAALRDR